MKIAFQKVSKWENKPHAEAELALRMLSAARSLDSFISMSSSNITDIESFKPDVVIPLHFFIPKLFDAFTVGCMWNPSTAIEIHNAWDNIKSYDGYAIASDSQEQTVKALKFRSPSPYLITRLYPSTNSTAFKRIENFGSPTFIGSNWSQKQQKSYFTLTNDISVFGPRDQWKNQASNVYAGEIPIDGKSFLSIYQKSGIGLALHSDEHNLEGIPSMRPFEIAASSAVMICDHNSFVQEEFGDSALYLDTSLEPNAIIEQLEYLTSWIKSHKSQAQEMAESCHRIFLQKFSLEILLQNIVNDINQFRGPISFSIPKNTPQVEIIIRSDGQDRNKLFRALQSIDNQTYKPITALLLYRGDPDLLSPLQEKIKTEYPDVNIKYSIYNQEQDRGSQFFSGIRASSASYIGFVDDDDILFSDHVAILLDCLTKNPDASLAYSGSVRIWEGSAPPENEELRKLAYFYEINSHDGIKACITSNSYLIQRNKIPWHIFNNPVPRMNCLEDSIFLIMMFDTASRFIFSGKVTSAFYWRTSKQDNSAFDKDAWYDSKKTFDLIKQKAGTIMAYMDYTTNSINNNYYTSAKAKIMSFKTSSLDKINEIVNYLSK